MTAVWNDTTAYGTTDYRDYSAKNYFGVRFGEWWEASRDNSSCLPNSSKIQSYIPSGNQELVKTCQQVYNKYYKTASFNETGALFHFHRDAFVIVFDYLNPKDLANLSEVSKCCYLVTKTNALWENQLKKLLPNATAMPMQVCCFTPEEQLKIIFKRIDNEIKPYITQYEKNDKFLSELRGSNGMNGEIGKAWTYFEAVGGQAAIDRVDHLMSRVMARQLTLSEVYDHDDHKATIAHHAYKDLDACRIKIAGSAYDGTVESFTPDSQQGLCLRLINGRLIHAKFDDQDKFEAIIRASEVAKNNTSQNSDGAIPQGPVKLDPLYKD